MYTPTPIATQQLSISPETCADVFRAEMALVRMEERIRFERIRPALCEIIARLEAISTIRIDGKNPSLRTLIALEDRSRAREELLPTSDENRAFQPADAFRPDDASAEAFRYMQTLRWLSKNIKRGEPISSETLLEIHSRCVFGEPASESGATFRTREYRVPDRLAEIYRAPSPDEVLPLVEDLCAFINEEVYTPNTQAAIAHFQFEGIKPFKRGLDRVGRAMGHAILYRRGLVDTFIPPIALMPAVNTKWHAERLLPYAMGYEVEGPGRDRAIDSWVRFCAQSVELGTQVMMACINAIVELENAWQVRVGGANKGSAVQELLQLLPGEPILSASSAMRLIDRSFSATNDALLRLERAGILTLIDGVSGRHRVFEAKEVFHVIDAMEKQLLGSDPVARDSFGADEDGV